MSDGSPLAGGRPIHARTLDVEVRRADGETPLWDVRGELVDVRKGGYVPIAGDLQPAGLLHHMRVAARFDASTRTLLEISAEQPAVAFEASCLSEGESCRDPVSRIEALAGTALVPGWERPLRDAIGGERGCSHVLVLARLACATLAWLARDGIGPLQGFRAGERVFHRSLSFDGAEDGDDALAIAIQLTDLHCRPAPEPARPMLRMAAQTEVRARARLGRSALELRALDVAYRERGASDPARPDWQSASAGLRDLIGTSVTRGMRRRLLDALPVALPGAPLAAALLDLAPAALQCLASDCDPWPAKAVGNPSLVVSGGATDSCWMWRAGGALARAREREPGRGA